MGNFLIAIGILFIALALLGIFKYKSFENKLLTGSKIDTAAAIFIILGLMFKSGFVELTPKLLLILIFLLLTGPVSTYLIGNYHVHEKEELHD